MATNDFYEVTSVCMVRQVLQNTSMHTCGVKHIRLW